MAIRFSIFYNRGLYSSRALSRFFSSKSKMAQTVSAMNGDELVKVMKSGKESKKDFVVIDVRDDDFIGGNIKGCMNYPSNQFSMHVNKLVEETKEIPLVVFHCQFSQTRGPQAAKKYAETRVIAGDYSPQQEVAVLHGGFAAFQTKFRDDPTLVENWDKKVWEEDWS